MTTTALNVDCRVLNTETIETMLYRCVTWTLRRKQCSKLRPAPYHSSLRIVGFERR